MDQDAIFRYVAETFSGVDIVTASTESGAPEPSWCNTFFIYDPHRNLAHNRTSRLPRSSPKTMTSTIGSLNWIASACSA